MVLFGALRGLKNPVNSCTGYNKAGSFVHALTVCSRAFSKNIFEPVSKDKLRNVAIIAHVDHGKTTLVEQLLRSGGVANLATDRTMDCNDIEKERGITILSKATRIKHGEYTFNIVDTPGHADFGGEVERILSMVDGVCLVVDNVEGPKTQTKFVLSKALLNANMKPIVVVNKCDRPCDKPRGEIDTEVFDLFCHLDANDQHMEYPTMYASGKNGWAERSMDEAVDKADHPEGMRPLLDVIASHVLAPSGDADKPFSFLVSLSEHIDGGLGPTVTGKVYTGLITKNDQCAVISQSGEIRGKFKIKDLTVQEGTSRVKTDCAGAGDIISISVASGCVPVVTDTVVVLGTEKEIEPLPSRPIDPPVIFVEVSPNTSPMTGKDGPHVSLLAIGNRLKKEALTNVAIEVTEGENKEKYAVKGRGELQLGVLLETMRREGFELSVSPPSVVYKKCPDTGKDMEPWETVTIDVPKDVSAELQERMSIRNAEMIDQRDMGDSDRHTYICASRLMLGLRPWLREASRGVAQLTSEFKEYRIKMNVQASDRKGVMVSSCDGTSTAHDLSSIQAKGKLFVGPQIPVYTGMIIGEHGTKDDIDLNCTKGKEITSVRVKGKEGIVQLATPVQMTIEQALTYINEDELVEVTPKRITLRKKELDPNIRKMIRRKQNK